MAARKAQPKDTAYAPPDAAAAAAPLPAGATTAPAAPPGVAAVPTTLPPAIAVLPPAALTAEAHATYQRAIAAQRAGDWATYGTEIARLGQILERLAAPR